MTLRSLLVVMLLVTVARANPTAEELSAKQRFARGQALVTERRYAEALAEFEAGYQLSHRPLFLFNMGECARSAGDFVRARDAYERYLRESPVGTVADTARDRLGALSASASAGTAAPVDGQRTVETSAAEQSASRPSSSDARPPQLAPAKEPLAARLTTSPSSLPPRRRRWPLWVGIGSAFVVGAVAVSVGVVYGTKTSTGCGNGCSVVDLH